MNEQRWLRIIPVALIMYTISYIDRTNVALALDPKLSTMMKDLLMDDAEKGLAAAVFFLGYVLLQIPGGYWASRWSARKIISLLNYKLAACIEVEEHDSSQTCPVCGERSKHRRIYRCPCCGIELPRERSMIGVA